MSDRTGRPYENLTQVIFQAILGQREFPNLKVEQDIRLQGKTTSHQIDVYWKFEFGGIPHEAIVQAKNWAKRVEQVHLLAFKAILDDLPGQPKGIFVTRNGYQEGAREFALAHGILLYELREADYPAALPMTAGGWAKIQLIRVPLHGLVTTSDAPSDLSMAVAHGFKFDIFTPKYTEINFMASAEWVRESAANGITSEEKIIPNAFAPHKWFFFNDAGENVGNLGTIVAKINEGMRKENLDKKRETHVFEPQVFITTANPRFPRVKVASVTITVEIEHTECTRRLKMSNISQLVMHQLNSDEKWWFGTTPQAIDRLLTAREEKTKSSKRFLKESS